MDLSILGRNTRLCQWAIEHLVPLVWVKRGLVNCSYCCKPSREEIGFDFFWGLWHMPVAFAMLVSPENSDADSATHFFMPMNRFNWWKKTHYQGSTMPQRERVTWILFAISEKNGCKQSKKCSTNKASPYCRQTNACIWLCLLYICPGVHLKRPKRASTIAKGSACQQLRPNSSRWRAEVMCFARRRQ